ncbi:DUF1707 domain-containing protein [Nonomuraea dietziae]|uniref:DUF1707 SHOCT-like domain-containing protein n=1 Tax=Nonomuraea dietziae TaxID=65515 RepID=UPI0031D7BB29
MNRGNCAPLTWKGRPSSSGLRVASVEGRLTLVELTDRTEAAYLATTHAQLALLTQDLPRRGHVRALARSLALPQTALVRGDHG